MIIADTSVWIDFFRRDSARFRQVLERGEIAVHTVVLGELATGNLRQRHRTLATLRSLPQAREGLPNECLSYIETHRLYGRGLTWNDVQLLVAAHLNHMLIWSLDQALTEAAGKFKLDYAP